MASIEHERLTSAESGTDDRAFDKAIRPKSLDEYVGQARSAALCATFGHDVEVVEYAPREIKQAVVGTGSATKEQVQHMVVSMLQLDATPTTDAADALAAAICHGNQRALQTRLGDQSIVAGLR